MVMNLTFLMMLGFALTQGALHVVSEDEPSLVLVQNKMKRHISKRGLNLRKATSNETENTLKEPYKSEFIFQNDSNNVAFVYWKHTIDGVIFLLTCEYANVSNYNKLINKGCNSPSNFYKSLDDGKTFDLLNKFFRDALLHSLYLTPLNRKFKILTDHRNKSIYLTRDNGVSFTHIKTSFAPTFIHFHPTVQNYIAAYDYTSEGRNSVYISTDSGFTWLKVASNVRNYFWSKENFSSFFIEIEDGKQIDKKTQSSGLYMCSVPCKSLSKVISEDLVPFSVYVGNNFVLVQVLADREIYVSYDSKKFEKLAFDKQFTKAHQHHAILNENSDEYLLGIIHPDLTVSLYLSGQTGHKMQFIQSDIVMETGFKEGFVPKIDFLEIGGSFGTFIVNKKNIGTLISYDKGHHWQSIQINSKDCDTGNCEITLYIKVEQPFSEFTAPLISKDSAPGVIIAQGYLGKTQVNENSFKPHKIFVSFDGGHYWKEHLDSMYGYAILDHGGLIAATPLTYTIDHGLSYTIDYGNTWQEVAITKRYSRIAAIITESSSTSLQLNVFGFLQEQAFLSGKKVNTWVVWQFDFTNLFTGVCKSDDYIPWVMHDNKCILGRNVTSKRRAPHINCLNGDTFVNEITITPCECVIDDFKCDSNYFKNSSGFCLPYTDKQIFDSSDCEGSYLKTKGYVKRFGNLCEGGIEKKLMPSLEPCPLLPPKVVKITASANPQAVFNSVTFKINQIYGFSNTTYQWNFNDGSENLVGTFNDMKLVQHVFHSEGSYVVKMTAFNKAGNVTETVTVKIVNEIFLNADIKYIEPALVDRPTEFILLVFDQDGKWNRADVETARYIWSFNDKYERGLVPQNTYNFKTPGTYKVEVQVITPSRCQTIIKNIPVFLSAASIDFTIEITKGQSMDEEFFTKFKEYLIAESGILDESRIIFDSEYTLHSNVRVYFCDYRDNYLPKNRAKNIVEQLHSHVNYFKPIIFDGARIARASFTSNSHVENLRKVNKDSVWIPVAIPIILMVVAVSIVTFLYRKKVWRYFFKPYDNMRNVLVLDMDGEEFIGSERI